jgi:hypothetical protein
MAYGECPNPQPDCPYAETGCYSDQHHQYWPSDQYTTPIERTFRNLYENKSQECRQDHDEIHLGEPPIKPSVEVMAHTIVVSGVHISRRIKRALNGTA